MSQPGDAPPNPEFSDSDREWLAALEGQEPLGESRAALEGLALRAALELRRRERVAAAKATEAVEATREEASGRRLQRLHERMQAEGLFGPAQAPAVQPGAIPSPTPAPAASNVLPFPWWRRRGALMALAASLFATVALVQLIPRESPYPPPLETHGAEGVQQAAAADPRRAAEQLAARLRAAGLRPGLYQRGKTYIVDVNLVSTDLANAASAFSALALEPAVGFNRVVIGPASR